MAHDRPSAPHRRQFLQHAGLGAVLGAAAAPGQFLASEEQKEPDGGAMPLRQFGRHDVKVSALGMGGHHLGDFKTVEEAIKAVHEAIDGGITFFDNCWEYWNGRAENWLGRALRGKRDKVFLMTKVCTHGRGKDVAMKQLDESLKRLQTDRLDLWQVHECVYWNDPERHFAKGGVIEALDEAKKAGKVRYVGFTGHKHPDIHLKMLSYKYAFDSVQMPLNPFDATYRSFQEKVLPEVRKQDLAAIGMKSMGGLGQPVLKGVLTAPEALRYAMSLPVAVTVSGIDSLEVLRQNLKVARGFKPMSAREMTELAQRCARAAGDGHLELYKSTMRYDGDVGREQHGFPPQAELPL